MNRAMVDTREFAIKQNPKTHTFDLIELWNHDRVTPGFSTYGKALAYELEKSANLDFIAVKIDQDRQEGAPCPSK